MEHKLTPGSWIAHAFNERELRGERLTIEILRACLESAPTWPETWTRQQGRDYVSAYLAHSET